MSKLIVLVAKRDDALIGKTVRIQSGQWKGYLGTVCDSTATHVQVELHSRLKKIMVSRERVAVAGDKFGSTEDPSRATPTPTSMMAPTTPFVSAGGATPMHGGATPMHGGATPMHDSGMGYVFLGSAMLVDNAAYIESLLPFPALLTVVMRSGVPEAQLMKKTIKLGLSTTEPRMVGGAQAPIKNRIPLASHNLTTVRYFGLVHCNRPILT